MPSIKHGSKRTKEKSIEMLELVKARKKLPTKIIIHLVQRGRQKPNMIIPR
jgi:hypothetical protein